MCGISGVMSSGGYKTVDQMLSAISHRGRDGHGITGNGQATLGHVRLAALDIAGGAQPMSASGQDVHIVFNGEIYNHLALRRRLPDGVCRTYSDTETLLWLAASEGDCQRWLPDLDGMFAFAALRPDGLLLARDTLGIKPLYVGMRCGVPVFASEIKALVRVGADSILEFPPGYVFSSGEGLRSYQRSRPYAATVMNPHVARRGLLRRLACSVRDGMTADVPAGVFLNGGIETSLIAALARRPDAVLMTFAAGVEGGSDLLASGRVAAFLGSRHRERQFSVADAVRALPEIIYHLESFDPALVRSAIPNWFAARLASGHLKIMLSGEGADVLFAVDPRLRDMQPDALDATLRQVVGSLHRTDLQRCDRMSMAHGIEARVPFLDHADVVDYALRISTGLKVRGRPRAGGSILCRAAHDVLPREVAGREATGSADAGYLGERLARFAETIIGDAAFQREREISDGVFLQSKEELLYFRLFREVFPVGKVLPLVERGLAGRVSEAPSASLDSVADLLGQKDGLTRLFVAKGGG